MTKTWLTGLGLLFSAASFGQTTDVVKSCAEAKAAGYNKLKQNETFWPRNAGLDLYDVKYHKLDIALQNTSIHVEGKVTTKAVVTGAQLDNFVFELHPSLTLDSVKVNGQNTTVTVNGTFKECAVATPLAQNTLFTAEIWYQGTPSASGSAAIGQGITNDVSPSWGNRVTWTLSEPYSAYEWWPCKQSLADKIDSLDVWLTVGDSLKAGSNGLLKQVTPLSGNRLRYEWKHRYPIDYYLISASVAKYIDYSFYAHPVGSVDSVLIQNYIYDNPQTLTFFQNDINQTGDFIEKFAGLFGPYPFENEKYGHCMAPLNGGMEHQTMTTQGSFSFSLTAHELGHQWFGDKVTCGSWKDIWVNEGFASYLEYIAYQQLGTANQARVHLNNFHATALSQPGGSVYVDDTTNPGRIFDSRLTYNKGATLVHMLRFLTNNDQVFFQALRTYLQNHAYSTATGEDVKAAIEGATGLNLENFFDEYYYGQGYPIFSVRWKRSAAENRVYVKLTQTTSMPSVTPLFHIPVEIQFQGSMGDTTVKVMSDASEVSFDFAYNRTVSIVRIDPNQWILNQDGSIIMDNTLSVSESQTAKVAVYPNPATEQLTLEGFAMGENVSVIDQTGRTVKQFKITQQAQTITVADLASGVYQLKAQSGGVFKFVKK